MAQRAAKSAATPWLAALKAGKDVRRSKVRQVRRAIAEGRYENNLKLQIAMDRLFRCLEE